MKLKNGLLFAAVVAVLSFVACQGESASDQAKKAASESIQNTTAAVENMADAAKNAVPTGPSTSVKFADGLEYNFGTIDEGEVVTHVFEFENTGSEPLVLSDAKGSCGCTVPDWPRNPIAPGEKGEIEVKFNSQGKGGKRNQKVTLVANTEPTTTFLYLKGDVTPKANAAAPAN